MQLGSQWVEGHRRSIEGSSKYAEEMRKWEAHYSQFGPPGRPYEFHAYPTRMYKASRPPKGGPAVFEGADASTDQERESLERIGFVWGGQAAALQALEQREFEIAELAANRAHSDRKMSEKAQIEADAADRATIQHLPAVPETPIKRRGRPKKSTPDPQPIG